TFPFRLSLPSHRLFSSLSHRLPFTNRLLYLKSIFSRSTAHEEKILYRGVRLTDVNETAGGRLPGRTIIRCVQRRKKKGPRRFRQGPVQYLDFGCYSFSKTKVPA